MNSTEPKKILIVTSEFPPQPGGIGNHAYNLAKYLHSSGLKVQVVTDQRSVSGVEEFEFDTSLPFEVHRIRIQSLRFLMYIKRIFVTRRLMKTNDHIIATGKFSLWNTAFLNGFNRKKIVAIVHGTEVNFKNVLLRRSIDYSLKRFNTIIAVSDYTKGLVAHLNKPVLVIPNGINVSEWDPENTSDLEIEGDPVITTVGRVSARKGQLNVIKILPHLLDEYPNLHYHCVGIPSEADHFIGIAKDLKVDKCITFHGALDAEKMKSVLHQTDVFVMMSSKSTSGDVEGFGIAILEANAMGIPAIGSLGCGIEDAIDSNVSGELVSLEDPDMFKAAMDTIMVGRSTYSKNARNWAEKHDWSIIIKKYLEVLG